MSSLSAANGSDTVELEIVLRVKGLGDKAQAAASSLRPDDATAPQWMSIVERVEGQDLVIELRARAPPGKVGSVRNTVDEILEYLQSMLKTLERVALNP